MTALLLGILSFMLEDTATTGSVESSYEQKRQFAADSHQFNLQDRKFLECFPDLALKICKGEMPRVDLGEPVAVVRSDGAPTGATVKAVQPPPPENWGALVTALLVLLAAGALVYYGLAE